MNYIFTDKGIYDLDCDSCGENGIMIMNKDSVDYENAVADFITFESANILEIGYGMGLSANQIQTNNPARHVIIEINEDVYNNAVEWAKNKDNVEVILGDCKEVIKTLEGKFDGIYHAADREAIGHLFNFKNDVKHLADEGCKLVMYNWDNNKDIFNKANYKKIETSQTFKEAFKEEETFIVYTTLINNEWDKVDQDPIYTHLK